MRERREEHVAVGKRPSSLQRLTVGATRDGTLTAITRESYGSGGVAAGAGVGVCHTSMDPCPHILTEHDDGFTNAGPCAAWRAPGLVQGIFALEQRLAALAERLGLDPVALRDTIDTSGTHDARARAGERRLGAERCGWQRRWPPHADPGPVTRGIGMAPSQWVSLLHPATACAVRVTGDGAGEAFRSAQDLGPGTRTVLAQVVAEEVGLRPEQLGSSSGDTRYPSGPPAGGSRVTGSLTPAARQAACRAARDLAARRAPSFHARGEDIVFADGRVCGRGKPQTALSCTDAVTPANVEALAHRADRRDDYAAEAMPAPHLNISRHGLGGVQVAAVTVDTDTGVGKVERLGAVHDCGRPITPKRVERQSDGGVIQGVSSALDEERHLDRTSGPHLHANIDQDKMVGSYEVPTIAVHLLAPLGRHSATAARGVAEPATVATAAALANAFYHATGTRIRTLPLTPAHVLAALGDAGQSARRRCGEHTCTKENVCSAVSGLTPRRSTRPPGCWPRARPLRRLSPQPAAWPCAT